jgi:hypothetical protein
MRDDRKVPAAVKKLSEREILVLTMYLAKGDTAPAVAKRLGITASQVRRLAAVVLSKLSHPHNHVPFEIEGTFIWHDGPDRVYRGDHVVLRTGILGVQEDPGWVCGYASCPNTVVPPDYPRIGGRPRRYCSNACKQRAYRERRKQSSVPYE